VALHVNRNCGQGVAGSIIGLPIPRVVYFAVLPNYERKKRKKDLGGWEELRGNEE